MQITQDFLPTLPLIFCNRKKRSDGVIAYAVQSYDSTYDKDTKTWTKTNIASIGTIYSEDGLGEIHFNGKFLKANPEFVFFTVERQGRGRFKISPAFSEKTKSLQLFHMLLAHKFFKLEDLIKSEEERGNLASQVSSSLANKLDIPSCSTSQETLTDSEIESVTSTKDVIEADASLEDKQSSIPCAELDSKSSVSSFDESVASEALSIFAEDIRAKYDDYSMTKVLYQQRLLSKNDSVIEGGGDGQHNRLDESNSSLEIKDVPSFIVETSFNPLLEAPSFKQNNTLLADLSFVPDCSLQLNSDDQACATHQALHAKENNVSFVLRSDHSNNQAKESSSKNNPHYLDAYALPDDDDFSQQELERLNFEIDRQTSHTLIQNLGIEFITIAPNYAEAKMPVDHRTCRNSDMGLMLNGGASIALAESLAGMASLPLCEDNYSPRGAQISANHLRPVRSGQNVIAKAFLLNRSKAIHLWDVQIFDSQNRLVSIVRVMNMIALDKRKS